MIANTNFYVAPSNLIFSNTGPAVDKDFPTKRRPSHASNYQGDVIYLLKKSRQVIMINRLRRKRFLCFVILLLTSVLFFSQTSLAKSDAHLPTGLCSSSRYQCDAETMTRWIQFQNSNGIIIDPSGFLSLGSCSTNGNNNNDVKILLALSKYHNAFYFEASIGFHNGLRGFQESPISQINTIFPDIYHDRNQLTVMETYAYIDYSEFSPYRYWVRYNNQINKMLMVVYFGFKNTFLCEFDVISA